MRQVIPQSSENSARGRAPACSFPVEIARRRYFVIIHDQRRMALRASKLRPTLHSNRGLRRSGRVEVRAVSMPSSRREVQVAAT